MVLQRDMNICNVPISIPNIKREKRYQNTMKVQ